MENGPLVVLVALVGVGALYLLTRQSQPAVTPTMPDACGGSTQRAIGAVDAGLLAGFSHGTARVSPDQACGLSSVIMSHSPSTSIARTLAPVFKPVGEAVGSVGALITGSDSIGPPIATLDCNTLATFCRQERLSFSNAAYKAGMGPYCQAARAKGCP